MPTRTTTNVNALANIIAEQRRDYDYLLHIYDRMRATEGVLLTICFGILAYLYHTPTAKGKVTLAEWLQLPAQDYGKVIYVIAFGAFAYGFIKLMLNVFGKNLWETAYETDKREASYTELESLQYIKKRYDECYEFNCKSYYKRKEDLGFIFFCIFLSATILMVIKTLK